MVHSMGAIWCCMYIRCLLRGLHEGLMCYFCRNTRFLGVGIVFIYSFRRWDDVFDSCGAESSNKKYVKLK